MLVALVLGSAAWMPTAGPVHRPCAHHRPGQRVLTTVQANFFNQAKEMIDYKMRHVGTMATVQHVVVGSFDELNQIEAEVKAAGVTEEAMADAAAKYSLDKGSAAKGGVVGPFMLGQKEFAFEKVCFDGDASKLLPCRSSAGFHLIKINKRGMSGPDGKVIKEDM